MFGEIVTCDVTRTSVLAFVSSVHSPLTSYSLGKVVALHAAVACSIPAEVALIYTMHKVLRGYCP